MPIKACLFDFDGTLADTLPTIFSVFKTLHFEYEGEALPPETVLSWFGPAEDVIIAEQYAHHPDVMAVQKRFYDLYREQHVNVPVPERLPDVLKYMAGTMPVGIVTGKGRKTLDISLNLLFPDLAFQVTIAGDEVENGKPHPEGLIAAAEQLGVPPQETMYVGDSNGDIQAARAAGMRCAGVSWFDRPHMRPLTERPDYHYATVREFELNWSSWNP
ncbi:MAG: HAD family hydrolase [candidate division KSB1 bacterium]|nr:HAD family hydrolase [candidate division KSB1 bacterium]